MDKDTSNNGDKRNWRERLGINAGKEMPRIAEEFQSATPPRAAVKPAPMAPRPQGKPVLSRANPVAQPGAQERLADKLKAQRDAQERLAEQRINAARQRVDTNPAASPSSAAIGAAKPKFTFAEEAQAPQATARPTASPIVKAPIITTPERAPERAMVPPPAISTPPRPGLGMGRQVVPPRPTNLPPPPITSQRPPLQQQRYTPTTPSNGYPPAQSYAPPPPAYRPIDPANRGYQPSGYQQQPYAPPPSYTSQRMAPPALPPTRGYGQQDMRPSPRVSNYRDHDSESDIFDEARPPRRATANEYQQAYRDAEQGYDDDVPQSRGPWVPLLLLALAAVVAGGLVWFYQTNMAAKPTAAITSESAPVVEAPAQPIKSVPEPAAAEPVNQPSKKLIYDRIVGDREVLGGDVMQSEEVPVPPQDNSIVDPAAAPADGQSNTVPQPTGGEDLIPLPLPPPPGEDGAGDQQGAAPSSKSSNEASLTPAAGDSQAAASSQGTAKVDSSAEASNEVTISKSEALPTTEQAPAPGELAPSTAAVETVAETTPEPVVAPVVIKKPEVVVKKTVKKAEKSLGSKPVVLVPPSKLAKAAANSNTTTAATDVDSSATIGGGGLYDGEGVIDVNQQPAPLTPAAPVKKKRTLADLFSNDKTNDAEVAQQQTATIEQPVVQQPAPQKPKIAVLPEAAPKKQASGGGGFVVQLASFRSREEATTEYGRLRSKHSAALSALGPIVTEAVVGGSTRYRLAAGTLGTRADASAVCAKLFAGGERDCIVRQQ